MPENDKTRRPRPRSIVSDERGAYYTEYTVVLVLVAVGLGTTLVWLGAPLLRFHDAVMLGVLIPTF